MCVCVLERVCVCVWPGEGCLCVCFQGFFHGSSLTGCSGSYWGFQGFFHGSSLTGCSGSY